MRMCKGEGERVLSSCGLYASILVFFYLLSEMTFDLGGWECEGCGWLYLMRWGKGQRWRGRRGCEYFQVFAGGSRSCVRVSPSSYFF